MKKMKGGCVIVIRSPPVIQFKISHQMCRQATPFTARIGPINGVREKTKKGICVKSKRLKRMESPFREKDFLSSRDILKRWKWFSPLSRIGATSEGLKVHQQRNRVRIPRDSPSYSTTREESWVMFWHVVSLCFLFGKERQESLARSLERGKPGFFLLTSRVLTCERGEPAFCWERKENVIVVVGDLSTREQSKRRDDGDLNWSLMAKRRTRGAEVLAPFPCCSSCLSSFCRIFIFSHTQDSKKESERGKRTKKRGKDQEPTHKIRRREKAMWNVVCSVSFLHARGATVWPEPSLSLSKNKRHADKEWWEDYSPHFDLTVIRSQVCSFIQTVDSKQSHAR